MNTSKQIKITAAIIFAIFIIAGSAHADMWVIEPGYVGIGTQAPDSPLEVEQTFSNETGESSIVDMSLTGSVTGGSKTNTGILVGIVSQAQSGSQTDWSYQNIYGMANYLDVYEEVGSAFGTHNNIEYFGDKVLLFAEGNYNFISNKETGTIVSAFGELNDIRNEGNSITSATGQRSSVIQGVWGGTIGGGYAFSGKLKNVLGGTFNNAYLLYGTFEGNIGTKWGIYLNNEDKNYFSGKMGIGTNAPSSKLEVVGDIHSTGKVTSSGGYDPPYVLYDNENRRKIIDRVMEEVPTNKLSGAVMFFNGETSQMELFLPDKGEFRSIDGELLETTGTITQTFEVEDRFYFDKKTGNVKAYKVRKTSLENYEVKDDHVMDPMTGKFYQIIEDENGVPIDKIEVALEEAVVSISKVSGK
jgi:hypothetical protein